MKKMKVLSLFAGIGGIDKGLEATGGFETVAFVENDKKCHLVLRKNWPLVPIFKDVREVGHQHIYAGECYLHEHNKEGQIETEVFCGGEIDVIVGGFPCQDISVGGNQEGIVVGKRSSLWKEYARLIKEVRPKYAIIENVDQLRNNGLGVVLRDLSRIGYDAEWHTLTATGVCNLPHQRKRLFIIAHARSERCDERSGQESGIQADEKWSSEDLSQVGSECQSEPIQVRQILSRGAVESYRATHAGRESTVLGVRRVTNGISDKSYLDRTGREMDRDSLISSAVLANHIEVDFETGDIFSSRIKGLEGIKTKLKGSDKKGYIVHNLSFDGVKKQIKAHNIVWVAKNGAIPEGYTVDHKNRVKNDNRLENLRLATALEQRDNQDRSETVYKLTPLEKEQIYDIYKNSATSMRELAKDFNISKSRVSQVIQEIDENLRKARIKQLGNSVCPDILEMIGLAILERENEKERNSVA